MGSVVKWHCIEFLHTSPSAMRIASRSAYQGTGCYGLAVPVLRLWHVKKEPSFRALVVYAKGNIRQKQKETRSVSRAPETRSGLPSVRDPSTISAPSLTEPPVVAVKSPAEMDERIASNKKEKLKARTISAPITNATLRAPILSWVLFPRIGKQIARRLSSLTLAISELSLIAALSAIGTILEQNETPQFYFDNYPEEHPLFGFLTWRVILDGSLDHIYTSWYYLGLIALLAASLVACSATRQFPMVKVARRWSFFESPAAFDKLPVSETLERARLPDLATLLMANGFEVFARGPALYAFKGLAGRYAPIGVHISLLLVMGGATLSAVGGFHGSVMIPQGLGFELGDALAAQGFLSFPSSVMNLQVEVNKFFIDYRETGAVSQFRSDISLIDRRNKEVYRKTIAVNDPLRYGGVTMYQTDWAISALQVRVDESEPYNLVMASLEKGDNKLFGTFLPLGQDGLQNARGISILARDLQSVVIYDQEGKFVGVRRPGSGKPISVDGVSIVIDDVIGSSGLELKMDRGVPIVYAGFGALMLTTCISYLSHSQIWALQNGTNLLVGGKSNRAKVEFAMELNKILDWVPDITVTPGSRPLFDGAGSVITTASVEEKGTSGEEEGTQRK